MLTIAWYCLLAFCCAFSASLGFIAGVWVGLSLATLLDFEKEEE
jgi:hypothetical protein